MPDLQIPATAHISDPVRELIADTVETRRHLHAHPELSFQEFETAKFVESRLAALDLPITRVLETGVTTIIEGSQPGKTLLVRADMDALPVIEANETSYRSTNPGVMHACGHDGHTSIGLSAARLIRSVQQELKGRAFFVFQPAEETCGAVQLIETGFLNGIQPDNSLGLHLWNGLPVGQVGVTAGPCMAASDKLTVTIRGQSGHGAIPEQTVDAIVIAGQVISALQQVVSRNVSPLESAVVTLGTISGGRGFNIIADTVEFQGTIRTFKLDVQDRVHERVRATVRGVAEAMGGEGVADIEKLTPPVVNDRDMTDLVRKVAVDVVGRDNVMDDVRTMGAEDMSFFLNRAPGCFFFVGSANEARGLHYPHHHPKFDFDEAALPIALEIMTGAVRRYLS